MTQDKKKKHYGNSREYLFNRILRDRPDIVVEIFDRKYKSARQAAIAAGIITDIDPEYKASNDLCVAWGKADLETRRLFLWGHEEEIDAAWEGVHLKTFPNKTPGPRPYGGWNGNTLETVPDIEKLIVGGMSCSEIAAKIGVTYRTLSRWRSGKSKPTKHHLEKITALSKEATQ
jgi:hypothetical protein